MDQLNREFKAALADPAVQDLLKSIGAEPTGTTPAEFGNFIASEADRWGGVIRKLGIKQTKR